MGPAFVSILALGAAAPVAFVRDAHVSEPVVVLGAVADLSAVPPELRRRVQGLEIARFRGGRRDLVFTTAQLQHRIRILAPALVPWLAGETDAPITVHLDRVSTPDPLGPDRCVRITAAVEAGATPTALDWEPAACPAAAATPLYLDPVSGTVRATRNLKVGDVLRAAPASTVAGVRPGQPLVLRASVGPVIVERTVEALQAARPGQRLFARASGGTVISIPYPDATP